MGPFGGRRPFARLQIQSEIMSGACVLLWRIKNMPICILAFVPKKPVPRLAKMNYATIDTLIFLQGLYDFRKQWICSGDQVHHWAGTNGGVWRLGL